MDTVFSIVGKIYDREHTDSMEDLDVNAAVLGKFLNTTLQTAAHLGQDYAENLRFVKNHFGKSVKQSLRIRQKSMVWQRLITKSTHGDRQAYCVTELIRSRMPRPMSSPTRCSVSEASKSNERPTVWTWALQRQDHLHVNVQRHCMERKKELQKCVNTIHRQLRIMLADSLAVVGHSWDLGQKRNCTELPLINPTEPGTKLPNKWCWISQIPVIQYFVRPVPLREGS